MTIRMVTVLVIIKLTKYALRCVCVAVPVNIFFVFISSFFAISKNAVHSLEPGERQTYLASHQASNCVQIS